MNMKQKRDKIKAYLRKVFDTLEGVSNSENAQRYIKMIDGMSDAQLTAFMKRLRDKQEQIFVFAPNLKNSITQDSIRKTAKVTGTKLFERVHMRDPVSGKEYLTNHEYLIIQMPIRRVKQFLMDKLSVPESDKKVDLLTGQVIKPDKGSSVSLIETQLIMDKGLDKAVLELIKVRGGDINAYAEYSAQIAETGSVSLENLSMDSVPRSAVVASAYLKAMHIDNNIVE